LRDHLRRRRHHNSSRRRGLRRIEPPVTAPCEVTQFWTTTCVRTTEEDPGAGSKLHSLSAP
jgi:hypothetical protein